MFTNFKISRSTL